MVNTIDAALLAQASYNQSGLPVAPTGWSPILNSTQMASGFTGNAFVSGDTLVIGFGGTDGLADIITDIDLAFGDDPVAQVVEGISYAAGVIAALPTLGLIPIPTSIVFVGHSLGGYIAQNVLQEYPDASAIVFNPPGVGGLTNASNDENENVTYYYSNPASWDGPSGERIAGAAVSAGNVHNLGELLNNNVNFVLGASGHPMDSMIDALQGNPNIIGDEELPISGEVWGNILAEQFRTGVISASDLFEMVAYGQDIFREYVLPSMRDSGTSCFLAGTPITMWPTDPNLKPGPDGVYNQEQVRADLWTKPIEQVAPTDLVVSFNDHGNMVPGYVPRTMVNESKIILDFHGTWVTPGHVYWCVDGKYANQYAPLIDILRTDGAVEHQSGTKIRASTGCEVGSLEDELITMAPLVNGQPDGNQARQIRLGTRMIRHDATEVTVMEGVLHTLGPIDKNRYFPNGQHVSQAKVAFFQEGPMPNPEDYVMIRSQTTLEDIYRANQWEYMRPQMPAPMVLESGPVQALPADKVEQMKRNTPMAMLGLGQGGSPMAERTLSGPGGQSGMNRKARKAAEAKQRKSAKSRKQMVH